MSEPSGTATRSHPLVRFAVGRRVTMTMALVGVGVLGALALGRLPLEFLPSISSSSMWVSVPYPSSSPDEVSRQIVEPLEDSFGTLNGLDRMSSQASADSGSVSLEFVDGTDMDL
ncbi:MAG: efflux RND transporter permease subunit, partial [Acidobacteria bacterium]|nr:efflux RND transporter permease subunit [Acidobacteriota bacterium]